MLWITSPSERTFSPKMNWPFSLLAIDELKINLKSITEMLENYVLGRWPMAAHILQVAYYDTLRELRVKMLEAAGYPVTSVSGNDNAMGLDGAVIAGANLIVVGFSAEHSVRAAMVLWFKTHYPKNSGRRLAVQQLGEVP